MALFTGAKDPAECDIRVIWDDSYTQTIQITDDTEAENIVPIPGYKGDGWVVDPDTGEIVADWIVSVDGPSGTVTYTLKTTETRKLSEGTKYYWTIRLFLESDPEIDTTTIIAGSLEVTKYKGTASA